MPQAPIVAAGAVVLRRPGDVLLVHRPRYDDWSLPKGKLDAGEHPTACAVREVAEETGLDVCLERPLAQQSYPVGGRSKVVHYWVGRVVGDDDVGGWVANDEVDRVRWVPTEEAATLLTHHRDRTTLAEALAGPARTHTLVVLRHGQALPRKRWYADDRFRPLAPAGEVQAERLVPVLAAYDVRVLVSSPSTRCATTLAPYAEACGREVATVVALAEETEDPRVVAAAVTELLGQRRPAVLCSHRPVLPEVFAAIGVPDPGLEPGEMLVVHHHDGVVVATELHLPT